MIVSHRHRFIFLHCRKTAGSSVKVALAPFLGDDDVVVGSLDEIIRSGVAIPRAMRRRLVHPAGWKSLLGNASIGNGWAEGVNQAVKKTYRRRLGANPPHAPASIVQEAFPREWCDYFTFCFVRNPYEQAVSDYLWRKSITRKQFTFRDFLEEMECQTTAAGNSSTPHRNTEFPYRNTEIYMAGGKVVVDFVGHYENLAEDFATVTRRIGLPESVRLPTVKRGKRLGESGIRSYYGFEEIDLARRIYRTELDLFGYTLDD